MCVSRRSRRRAWRARRRKSRVARGPVHPGPRPSSSNEMSAHPSRKLLRWPSRGVGRQWITPTTFMGSPDRRVAECLGARKEAIQRDPDMAHFSTSYAERNNLNVRMHSRRMTRLTNAFSKKAENHAHAMALRFLYYNFVRIHKTLKVTPAMAAGVTDRLWEVADMVAHWSLGGDNVTLLELVSEICAGR
jgi:hypothetical protein